MMISMTGKRRLMIGVITLLVALVILSFVLPYVGSGDSGLTKLFP
jgi:hypothetical protein